MNIRAGDEKNYFVFMLDHKDEEDGVMIGFGVNYHKDFSAFLHLAPKYLKELIGKYALKSKATNVENMTIEQYLIGLARGEERRFLPFQNSNFVILFVLLL